MMTNDPPSEIVVDALTRLKRLQAGSAALIFRAIDSDREHLRPWLPFVDETKKASDTEMFIKSILHTPCSKKDLVYEIWYGDHFAGLIAMKEIDRWNKKTELGYWIISDFEGLGIITQSCRELIRIAFRSMGMQRVQIKIATGNARSGKIPERLNFKFEGIERSGEVHHKKTFDLMVYSLLRREWEDTQPLA